MLENINGPDLAQVGWLKQADGSRYNFSEVSTYENHWVPSERLYGSSSVGSSPEYKMTYSSNTFHFLINNVDYRDFSSPTYGGCDAFQSGEITNLANQMPGEPSNPDPFTASHVRRASDNSWFLTNLWFIVRGDSSGNQAGAFHYSTHGSPESEIDIWDGCQ